jgi:hypothetical protein
MALSSLACTIIDEISRFYREVICELLNSIFIPTNTRNYDPKIGSNIGGLTEEALSKRSSIKGPFVIVIDTDPYPSTELGGTWWDVGVPEVSERAQVQAAYASYVENKKSQRMD